MTTALIDTLVYPSFTASSTCSKMRVSASSCVHGARPDVFWDQVQRTSAWWVLIMCLPVSRALTQVARKENSSTLLLSIWRNSCQFPGMALCGSTHLQTPFLSWCVSAFRLSGEYLSHTHHIQSADMLQLLHDVWCEHLLSIIRKLLIRTRS